MQVWMSVHVKVKGIKEKCKYEEGNGWEVKEKEGKWNEMKGNESKREENEKIWKRMELKENEKNAR